MISRTGFRGACSCVAAVLLALFAARPACAAESAAPPTMATESASEQARSQRGYRVSLQIPEALRALLAKKIDQRILRNTAKEKQLRVEAMGLLSKFIAETPEGSSEMPEALLRMGELEWEEARDAFLSSFQKWEALPPEQRAEKDPPTPVYGQARARFSRVLKNYKAFSQYDLALYVDGFGQ